MAGMRAAIAMRDVVALIDFVPTVVRGDQLRGPCPLHGSKNPKHEFVDQSCQERVRCFRCGAAGNHLDLWVAVTKLPFYEAAEELCRRLDLAVPRLVREQRRGATDRRRNNRSAHRNR